MVRTGERGDFLQKVPPLPRTPLSPFKNSYQGEPQGTAATAGASPARWSPGRVCGERHFFLIFSARWRTCHVKHARIRPNSSPLVIRFLLFAMLPGDRRTRGRPARPDGLRSSRQSFLRDGWGRGGEETASKRKTARDARFLLFAMLPGRLADKGRPARPDGLRYSRQSFLRDGWGARGEEKASKRKTVRDARFLLFAMLPGDWRTRDGLRDRTAYDPPGKVFLRDGWGARGEETASKRKTVRDARFLLFAMLPGDWRTRDDLRDQTAYDPPGKVFLRDGWGARGEETASKRKTVRDARFLLFAMLPGDWRTRDGLRDQTAYDPPDKVFCGMDGGRGGKRQHQKEKQYEMPAFFFLPCCRETGGQGTACETRRPTILPAKFFAGWMGGAGGRKGAFFQKSPLPSPRIHPRSLLIVFAFFHERIRALVAVRAQHCQGFVPREDATAAAGVLQTVFRAVAELDATGAGAAEEVGRGFPGTDAAICRARCRISCWALRQQRMANQSSRAWAVHADDGLEFRSLRLEVAQVFFRQAGLEAGLVPLAAEVGQVASAEGWPYGRRAGRPAPKNHGRTADRRPNSGACRLSSARPDLIR